MYIIKLDAIDSTNAYLKQIAAKALPKDYTIVVTNSQTQGRGQMGTQWQAEKGKSLTVSVFKVLPHLKIEQQFYISMVVSLAVSKALTVFNIPKLGAAGGKLDFSLTVHLSGLTTFCQQIRKFVEF